MRDILLGTNKGNTHNSIINFIIILMKYYIFIMKTKTKQIEFEKFKRYLYIKINLEKQIALTKGKLDVHNEKWRNFI